MSIEIMVAVALAMLTLAAIVFRLRSRGSPSEEEVLKELGFIRLDHLPSGMKDALQGLYLPSGKKDAISIKRILRRSIRAADIYFLDVTVSESEQVSYRQSLRSLHVFRPHWNLPQLTVVTMKEAETWSERMIASAISGALGKQMGRLEPIGSGEFTKRAWVFGKSQLEARQLLNHRVQKALMSLPYSLLETQGSIFLLGRPAQAGSAHGTQDEFRQLMEAARIVAEQYGSIPH